ncbi:hypothetical protein C0W44_11480 [Photobacterium leiognathi subsp. mandapamensis]|nr:hypothetical protein C0W44_11480 [Photobacterium leiognathi subsp. mandapamensis]
MSLLKRHLLLTLPFTLLSASSFADINSNYIVSSITLSADHNESLGVPMMFYANGRMQSKLNINIAFADKYGTPVSVSNDEVKNALSFYIKNNDTQLGRDKDCTYGSNCWGFSYNENSYAHQINSVHRSADNLPNSRILSNASNKLTAWVYSNETAQYRQICAKVRFTDGTAFDSCEHPRDENALYQSIQPKVYGAAEFADIGQGEKVWEDAGDGFYFEKAEVRNFYITPLDTSVTMTKVAMDNNHESDNNYVFLNDQWLGCYGDCPNGFRSVKGYIFEPGRERTVSDEYVWNTAAGEGRTATWRINQRLRSVTLSQLLFSGNTSINDSQKEYRFTAFDQYGNPARLKLTYPLNDSSNGNQKWDYTKWQLTNQ